MDVPVHRVIDLERNPLGLFGAEGQTERTTVGVLPASVLALPKATVALVERSAREDGAVECLWCGAAVGAFLEERDGGLLARERWLPYTVWEAHDGVCAQLCEECSYQLATDTVGGFREDES